MTQRLQAFTATGVLYTVIQMEQAGEIDFVRDNGQAVSRLPDGTFRIDETGEILRIGEPNDGSCG
ncbi:hypothetical protein [Pseudomonas sp.]|uniref:hypothetical protein n=1 Tax=Pseudomonas sp. TaxID=306 RepID=UPI0025E90B9A|nr:hypothetical protein [Pseudomonas sp.]